MRDDTCVFIFLFPTFRFITRCVKKNTHSTNTTTTDDDKKDEDEIASCRLQRRLFPRITTKDSEISCSGASRKGAS